MFLISSPITAAFPSSSSTMVNSCAQAASAAGHSGTELFNLTALKALKKLSISSVGSASSCGSSGLRRTVSSLHGMPEMCSHQEDLSKCIVQAKQVEMDFESTSSQSFYVTVKAPNGELSRRLDFNEHSRSVSFTPKRGGCGHGDWTITVHQLDGGKVVKKVRETINLDGVGTLFFAVDDQMQLRLKSQEFLRLPSASQCCSSRKHA